MLSSIKTKLIKNVIINVFETDMKHRQSTMAISRGHVSTGIC